MKPSVQARPDFSRTWSVAAVLLLACIAGILFWRRMLADPGIVLLMPESGAHWITAAAPYSLGVRQDRVERAYFRARLRVGVVPPDTLLTIHSLKNVRVFLDGAPIYTRAEHPYWRVPHQVEFGANLTPGVHWLGIEVTNRNGPCAVLAHCASLGLQTGTQWHASTDGRNWTTAQLADEPAAVTLSQEFPKAHAAFADHVVAFSLLWVAIGALSLWAPRFITGQRSVLTARCILFALWVLLAVNNFHKLPPTVGFDVDGHLDYVEYIVENGRLPLATDGWQMFQSPLYYLIEAAVARTCAALALEPDGLWRLMRLLSLAAGAAQIELGFRATRYLWPDRSDLQVLGSIFAGLLPMNLYMCQTIGNEPLAGALTAGALVLALKLLCTPLGSQSRWLLPGLGLLLGLALLTKVTPVLLLPVFAVLLILVFRQATWSTLASAFVRVYGVGFLVAGWYYLRNWWHLGRPFVSGWAADRQITWWQSPGYRTLEDFYRFGSALGSPIYSGIAGFWDSLYSTFWLDGWLSSMIVYDARPPWNYGWMIAGAWLAILPMAAIVVGAIVAFSRSDPPIARGIRFALGCVAIYLAAMLWHFLEMPAYSSGKATYSLGLTPCYAILAVAGFDRMTRHRFARAAVYGAFGCWAVASYFAYFVW